MHVYTNYDYNNLKANKINENGTKVPNLAVVSKLFINSMPA